MHLQLVCIDEEVSPEQSRHPEAEQETLEVHCGLGHEDEDGEDSEPLEKGLVGHRAAECPKGAAAIRSQTKGVDVHKVEGVEADQE